MVDHDDRQGDFGNRRLSDPALARALFGTAESARKSAEHPSPETLLDYHQGKLDAVPAGRTAEHLVQCRECALALLDLADLTQAGPEPLPETGIGATSETAKIIPRVPEPDFATEAAWRGLRQSLPGAESLENHPAENRARAASGPIRQWTGFLLAALLLLSAGLGLLIIRLQNNLATARHELASLLQPELDLSLFYLDETTRDSVDGPLELPADRDRFVLILTPPPAEGIAVSPTSFALQILDSQGRHSWGAEGLIPNSYGTLRLGLSRRQLGPGTHIVRLLAEPTGDLVAEHSIYLQNPRLRDPNS